MTPRQPELIGQVFTDKNNVKYEGQRFIQINDKSMPTGFITTEINYLHGKIHGKPAIIYPDGLEEDWDNGTFIKVSGLPFPQREGLFDILKNV